MDAGEPTAMALVEGGLGIQYNLTPQFGVRAEYERYKFDVLGGPKSDFVSVGAVYRF